MRLGLEHTRGNYKALVQLFNMEPQDYKRFLNFLRKYGATCRSSGSGWRRSVPT